MSITSTVDISIGGTRLKDKLPDNIKTSFSLTLQSSPPIALEAVIIDNADNGARLKFLPTESIEDLRDFLLDIK